MFSIMSTSLRRAPSVASSHGLTLTFKVEDMSSICLFRSEWRLSSVGTIEDDLSCVTCCYIVLTRAIWRFNAA
jgi:hypothetical protein